MVTETTQPPDTSVLRHYPASPGLLHEKTWGPGGEKKAQARLSLPQVKAGNFRRVFSSPETISAGNFRRVFSSPETISAGNFRRVFFQPGCSSIHSLPGIHSILSPAYPAYFPVFGLVSGQKKSGIELLSHTLMCSIIVAWPLNDRVRDGNVCCKPAIDTGKKGIKRGMEGTKRLWSKSVEDSKRKYKSLIFSP